MNVDDLVFKKEDEVIYTDEKTGLAFHLPNNKMVTIYNAKPQTVSLEDVLGRGATGETSKGGSHNVDPNGFVVQIARNIGISFGD